jgi:hypothetical protein
MNFEEFESEAHRMWAEIPAEYKEGIDGLVVKREVQVHPEHDDYYTLGMCFTEPYPSSYMGPDSTRSILALYHGSFVRVADGDPGFPWEEELWETITHELRHHLEFLAEDDELEALDYALEQSFRRDRGESFDPWFHQSGIPLGPDYFRVEHDVYVERRWRSEGAGAPGSVEFDWDGVRWRVSVPEDAADLQFVRIPDLDAGGGWLHLVLIRDRPFGERMRRLIRQSRMSYGESEGSAERVGDAPGSPGPEDRRPGGGAGGPPSADGDDPEPGEAP